MSPIDAAAVIIDLLQRGHAVEFRVRGDSMHPVIREDDSVHVEPLRDIRVGDVVLTDAERGLTAHRVIAMRGDTIVTRGDNAPHEDPPVVRARVLGKVTHLKRNGKRHTIAREIVLLRTLR
ncbi:MAG TPA: S24/S26 family peptidase, partial [Thermoanaerobaculia bacterium]